MTSRSAQIIKKIPITTYIPIYFLDIEIRNEERNGFEIAQKIHKHDPDDINDPVAKICNNCYNKAAKDELDLVNDFHKIIFIF